MKEKTYSLLNQAYGFVFNLKKGEQANLLQLIGMAVALLLLFAIITVARI